MLLLGPLYHLLDRADRVRAWHEAARVVRPGGPVVAAAISRFASLFDGFVRGFYFEDPRFAGVVSECLAHGGHRNPGTDLRWFTTAYFHRPEELAGEIADAGLAVDRVVAVESALAIGSARVTEILSDPGQTAVLLDWSRRIEAEPSLLGASPHLLGVAHRR